MTEILLLRRDVPDLEEAREATRRIVRDGKQAGEVISRIRGSAPREKLDLNETLRHSSQIPDTFAPAADWNLAIEPDL